MANEPEFFCGLIELLYKKRHSDDHEEIIPEHMTERIYQIFHNFSVIPGTDWDGNYCEVNFCKWIDYCITWSKAEDREAVVQRTIGNGLAYAKKDANGLIDDFIMKELNKIENHEMRNGYQLGVLNQRGFVMIDPEGKPEFQLAERYKEMAEAVEAKGYAKFAETLHLISENYIREAESNIRVHRLEQEARIREEENMNY